jgi:hypothetical protein
VAARRSLLFASVGLSGGLVFGLWSGVSRALTSVAPGAVRERADTALPRPAERLTPPERVELASPGAGPAGDARATTARGFLAQHYGARWPEVQARMEGKVDLDQPYACMPWEVAELELERCVGVGQDERVGLVQSELAWPAALTAGFVRDGFQVAGWDGQLDEADLGAIQARVAPKNAEIEELAQFYVDRLDFYLHEKWQRGDYLRGPFTTAGLSEERGFYSQSHAGFGWAVTLTLRGEECPDVPELRARLEGLCQERDRLVLGYLARKVRR